LKDAKKDLLKKEKEKKEIIDGLIYNAEHGVYHEDDSIIEMPILTLIHVLHRHGLDELAEKAKEGRYES